MTQIADVVICGAGIAGVSAAYHLAIGHGLKQVVVLDDRPPLTLTSDKSTEAYRNWWPGPDDAMVRFMNRSIELLEGWARESGDVFLLNRRGYVYATADPSRVETFKQAGERAAAQGAGALRLHPGASEYIPAPAHGFEGLPDGADLITDAKLIRQFFPYLSERTAAVIHARRCGWFSGQQLGMYLLERARARGVELIHSAVEGVDVAGGRVAAVRLSGGETISTNVFVNAAGPLLNRVGRFIGVELPIFSELHAKVAFKDHLGVIPRDAPLLIWADAQKLEWSDEERGMLAESDDTAWMLNELPPGAHTRPEGGGGSNMVLMLWACHTPPVEPVWPLMLDPSFPDLALRGLAAMIPGLKIYFEHAPRPTVDGGYYTKTRENRPLIGPMGVEGAYVIGALSGYGLMAAPAAGELLAAHVAGGDLPPYARAFAVNRFDDAAYRALLEGWDDPGQL